MRWSNTLVVHRYMTTLHRHLCNISTTESSTVTLFTLNTSSATVKHMKTILFHWTLKLIHKMSISWFPVPIWHFPLLSEHDFYYKITDKSNNKTHAAWIAERRVYRDLRRQKRESFWTEKVCSEKSCPHKLWRSVNDLMGRGATPVHLWISSYLANRTQYVHCPGSRWTPLLVWCGVPQGSVLGPSLFLLYTADLVQLVESFGLHPHLYADDTQIYGFCRRVLLMIYWLVLLIVSRPSLTGCGPIDSN